MKKAALTLIVSLLSSILFSSGYTTKDIINSMLINSTEIRAADEQVIQSSLDVKDARANMMPNISLVASAVYMPFPLVSINEEFTIDPNEFIKENGGSNTLDLQPYTNTFTWDSPKTFYSVGLSVSQPLVTWGKLSNMVRLSKEIESARKINRTDTEKRLISEVKVELDAVSYMNAILSILDNAIEASESLTELVKDSAEYGMAIKADYYDAEIMRRSMYVSRAEIEKQMLMVLESLRAQTGISDLNAFDIMHEPNKNDYEYILSYDSEDLIELATSDNSLLIQMLNKQKNAYEITGKIAKANFYLIPDLALNVSFGYGGKSFPFIEDGWKDNDDWRIMVNVGISANIFDGGKAMNNIKRSESNIRSSEIELDENKNLIRSNVTDLYASGKLSMARIEYLEIKAENSLYKLNNAIEEFESGSSSKIKVLQAELEYYSDSINLINEYINLSQSSYSLYYLTGIDTEKKPILNDGLK